uniref:Uncharacterized protein n=1 Tax=Magallana gigas TaxID=29159 RepID=A0A8W8K6W2_MAGGI
MGLLQSCFAKINKVGVMKEEAEVYEKVRRAMVTEDVTEKGGLSFGLTFVSEEEPKMPPRRLTELKKEDFEKWRGKGPVPETEAGSAEKGGGPHPEEDRSRP